MVGSAGIKLGGKSERRAFTGGVGWLASVPDRSPYFGPVGRNETRSRCIP